MISRDETQDKSAWSLDSDWVLARAKGLVVARDAFVESVFEA